MDVTEHNASLIKVTLQESVGTDHIRVINQRKLSTAYKDIHLWEKRCFCWALISCLFPKSSFPWMRSNRFRYILYIYTALKTWLAIEARFTKTGEISMRAQSYKRADGRANVFWSTDNAHIKTEIEPDHFHNAQRNLPRAVQMYRSTILLPYMVHLKGKLP